jgi:ribonuclease R
MAKSKKPTGGSSRNHKQPVKNLTKEVIAFFRKNHSRLHNYKQVSAAFGLSKEVERQQLNLLLQSMKQQGILEEKEKGKYNLKMSSNITTGIAELTASGAVYVIREDSENDVYIPKNANGGALTGDLVKVIVWDSDNVLKPRGEIIEIIKRSKTEFVGRVEVNKQFAFFIPDNARSISDVFIPPKALNGAQNGDKVIVKITDWEHSGKNPAGEVKQVLGKVGENDAEIHAIMAEFDLPFAFPKEVEKEANLIPLQIPESEINKRKDFRKVKTFTIDPEDAKDFDDALSVRLIKDGLWEIGVHIADVTHYLNMGTKLDDEAMQRATSVYLVDRVIPMLPEILSNKVCSLVPHEDRLCYSAVFVLNAEAEIQEEWFGRTVIHSDHRFSYEQAQMVIETGEGPMKDEIAVLQNLALKLREKRYKHGAIAFDKQEVKFNLDDKGKPLGVFFKVMKDSNKLIEDFMLLANRRVAEKIGAVPAGNQENLKPKTSKKQEEHRPFVYRIHDDPNPEKLQQFSQFVARFGYQLKTQSRQTLAKSMNSMLQQASGKKEGGIIEQLAIRTMAKAIYSTENIGHYGLAFDYYTHFTSPIRRYPDVLVHRLLDYYLFNSDHQADAKMIAELAKDKSYLEQLCKHSSEQEKMATEAERASVKYKQIEFLSDKTGQEFDGIISGVTEYGLYVEIIENHCEGMVKSRDMTDDFYVFDEDNYCYVGRRKRIIYQLGDKVKIRIKRCDLIRKQVDFTLINKLESPED